MKAVLQLETLTCPSCVQKIEAATKSFDAIEQSSIKVGFNSSKLKFNFDEEKLDINDVVAKIEQVGYNVEKVKTK